MMRFLVFFLFLAAQAAPAGAGGLWPEELVCKTGGKIKYIYKGVAKTEAAAYCYSADHSYLVSPGCRLGKECAALAGTLRQIPDSALSGSLGSPGFKLCRRAGGDPQLLEYFDGEKWWAADRCLFTRDGSFVDTGILVRKRARAGRK
jgi:hypothetical protein